MNNFAKLLSFFDGDFRSSFGTFVIVAATIIILQCGLFWLGGLLYPSVVVEINSIFGLVMVAPLIIIGVMTNYKGNRDLMIVSLAIIGSYVCVVWCFHWGILICCMAVLYLSLRLLSKIGADLLRIRSGVCTYLLYCIGAYFAMIFNGLEPAINAYGIMVLSVATLYVWFIPASE